MKYNLIIVKKYFLQLSPGMPAEQTQVLKYQILSEDDFGQVLCWGQNRVGRGDPCKFRVERADRFQSVEKCSAKNITTTSFKVKQKETLSSLARNL